MDGSLDGALRSLDRGLNGAEKRRPHDEHARPHEEQYERCQRGQGHRTSSGKRRISAPAKEPIVRASGVFGKSLNIVIADVDPSSDAYGGESTTK